jgi:hypothetical protein
MGRARHSQHRLCCPKACRPAIRTWWTRSVLCLLRLLQPLCPPHLKKLRCELKGTLRSLTILRVPSQAAASLQAARRARTRGEGGQASIGGG